ncbi:MAG: hypothetical protein Q9P14_17580 [candidate division KSB1 bacterium]|nr:hypothetical protein [candidate division KSB1 bacterium]
MHFLRQLLHVLRNGHRRAHVRAGAEEHYPGELRGLRHLRGGLSARRAQTGKRSGRRPVLKRDGS